jgi:NAD(P)-dependent dehydrogenase (short-subunit alcohol dehydrogenase family)
VGQLDGLRALVTGAASQRGLGRGIALGLAHAGADVVVSDIGQRSLVARAEQSEWRGLPSVVDEIKAMGRRAEGFPADISQWPDVERLVADTVGCLGGLDIIVNNAAAPQESASAGGWEVSLGDWQAQLAVNLTGPFLLAKAAIPHLLGNPRGRIINIASVAAKRPVPRRPGYNASKHGLIGLTRSLAADLAPEGVTVNAICPGVMATDRAAAREDAPERRDRLGRAVTRAELAQAEVPAGREGSPEDVAGLAVFLASTAGAYITGQAVNVDGGMYMA